MIVWQQCYSYYCPLVLYCVHTRKGGRVLVGGGRLVRRDGSGMGWVEFVIMNDCIVVSRGSHKQNNIQVGFFFDFFFMHTWVFLSYFLAFIYN